MKSDGWSEVWLCCLCFLCSLLFFSWRFLFSSPLLTPSCTVWRQHPRSAATSSQLFGSMSVNFMSLLQTSLKRSIGRPAGRRPKASWPYRMSLGMRPSSMRCTCPSQHIRRWQSMRCMLREPAFSSTAVLVIYPAM